MIHSWLVPRAPLQWKINVIRACAVEKLDLHLVSPYWFIVWWETGHHFAASLDLKYPYSPVHTLDLFWIYCFSTLKSGFKNIQIYCHIWRMGVDGSHIRIEKVVDSKISGYAWTGSKLQALFKYLPLIEGLHAKRAYIEFWPIFIFCRIERIFGRLTCFDMKSIVP